MTTDEQRIAAKAHEIWESEGRPHGRDREHWDQAKEIIALQDSASDALLPRTAGASEPVEEKRVALDNEGQFPGLTDLGDNDLTSTAREPEVTQPRKAAAKKVATTDAKKTGPVPAARRAGAKASGKAK